MESKATEYFNVWNKHDVEGLRALLAPEAVLRDWDVEVSGRDEVASANGNIFSAVPKINIEVLHLHPSTDGKTVCCEILVKLNDDAGTVLKVVDVISFSDAGLITAVRAYKG